MQPDDPLRVAYVLQVETRDVMLVGYIPHLDRLFRRLLDDAPATGSFPLNGLVAVERTGTGWVERWRLDAPSRKQGPSGPPGVGARTIMG